jgi:hypothetical protein
MPNSMGVSNLATVGRQHAEQIEIRVQLRQYRPIDP